jgi:segregation and condensation protein B
MDQTLVTRIVEAALLAASQPLTVVQLNALFPLDEPAPEGSIQAALQALQDACAERGVELVEVASGWRFQVQADVHPWVARLWTERQTKYTRATLETLALIAYRQPITRGEIEQVRGVAVNSSIIKALEEREWIRVVGHRDVPGKPELLATTKTFLDYFGLKRLDELPPLSELRDLGELEPQLPFAAAIPAGAASASTSAATGLETMPGEDSDIEHEQDHEDMAADAMSDSNGSDEDTTSPAIADTDIETDSAESIGDIETDTDHPGDDANPASSEQKQ